MDDETSTEKVETRGETTIVSSIRHVLNCGRVADA